MPLIAALIALLAGVLGVTIGGVLSHRSALRQQHRAWLREQRFEAYQAFIGKLNAIEPDNNLSSSDEAIRFYALASQEMMDVWTKVSNVKKLTGPFEPASRGVVLFTVLAQMRAEFGVGGHVHSGAEQFLKSQSEVH